MYLNSYLEQMHTTHTHTHVHTHLHIFLTCQLAELCQHEGGVRHDDEHGRFQQWVVSQLRELHQQSRHQPHGHAHHKRPEEDAHEGPHRLEETQQVEAVSLAVLINRSGGACQRGVALVKATIKELQHEVFW